MVQTDDRFIQYPSVHPSIVSYRYDTNTARYLIRASYIDSHRGNWSCGGTPVFLLDVRENKAPKNSVCVIHDIGLASEGLVWAFVICPRYDVD